VRNMQAPCGRNTEDITTCGERACLQAAAGQSVITVGIAEERAILVVGSPLRCDGHVLERQTF
jgi:hypothetical protein